MKSICVYCASSIGKNPLYAKVAVDLGETLATYGIRTIYGGAKLGLWGSWPKELFQIKEKSSE